LGNEIKTEDESTNTRCSAPGYVERSAPFALLLGLFRSTIFLFCLLVLTGCESCDPLKIEGLSSRKQLTLYAVHHDAQFSFQTAGEAAAIGYAQGMGNQDALYDAHAAMAAPDTNILGLYKVKDPSIHIKETLARGIADTYGMSHVEIINVPLKQSENRPDEIKKHLPGPGLVLSVRTFSWMIVYKPMNWSRYNMYYTVKVTLFDSDTEEILFYQKEYTVDKKTAPKRQELFQNKAALFREMKRGLAEECLREIRPGLGLPAVDEKTNPAW
jgi:hypothetical protein